MGLIERSEGRPTLNVDSGPLVIESRDQWESYAYALEREVEALRQQHAGAVAALPTEREMEALRACLSLTTAGVENVRDAWAALDRLGGQ